MAQTEHMVSEGGIVIYNPTAGRGRGGLLRAQVQQMMGDAWEWRPTMKAGHATELAREAAQTAPVVIGFGGDGTVGDVARGIIGTDAVLGVIPVGTGNDFARNLGLSLDITEAVSTVLAGNVRRVDYGVMNGVPFINNAGLGFDACVMRTMNTSIRFARGKPAFILATLKTLSGFKPFDMTITFNDEPPVQEKAMLVSILNGRMYGAGMQAAPKAEMDDGQVDVMVVKALPKPQLLALFPRVIDGKHENHAAILLRTARTVKITTRPQQPLNIDGDVLLPDPVDVTVVARGLRVLVR